MDSANSLSMYNTGSTMSSADEGAAFAAAMVFFLLYFVFAIFVIITMWKMYRKANKPGWAAIVPVYNYVVLLEIVGRPLWWVLLTFVPLVNIYIAVVVALDLAKSFGKSTSFGVANFLVPFITYPILAFSKNARYVGPVAEGLDSFAPAPDRAPTPSVTVQGQPVPPAANGAPDTATQQNPAPQSPEAPENLGQPRPPQA